jgi:hypothetical protein
MVENRCQDKLRILRWERHIGAQAEVHHVCCAEHVLELVVHWMTTGSLDYPFARFGPNLHPNSQMDNRTIAEEDPAARDSSEEIALGELSIDRESIKRILAENPECLHAVLAALLDVLESRSGAEDLAAEERRGELYVITHRA